jgi:hypothetical protein
MGGWRFGVVGATVLVAGCSLLTDLSGLSGGGALSTNASDAAADFSSAGDAGLDAKTVTDAPLDVDPSSPCGSGAPTLLVGSNDLTKTVEDSLAAGVFDTYGYVAAKDGIARCAWLYVSRVSTAGSFTMAVYANVAATTDPGPLLAQARITSVAVGWNAAPLDKPLTIAVGQTLWLGFAAEGEGGAIRPLDGCTTPLSNHVGEGLGGVPHDPFAFVDEYPANCSAAAYLAP